ncbi:protein serine phosphatase [Streptomyces albidoflavus]|uniref:SpoIIE family protein phosphatase n=1 Tax=Streptomyces albidoflavus TaxID=1886 RepID=UPI000BADEA68|nr:GAF domain-containing SpoIIE family protein phosphatase [Streptomyces albidoflavus]PAX84830.1 protein serine phosphatase [Streptomyces albidoflavus]PAX87070.1 protein serine phosphatase [Streptomyces albidoflavus]PBO15723.1 protein serine phosphatase [Streptomyces albidoflavus]PBO21832.1 protein serine phosphatase [Streptomyces albidoflavus]PBO31712.1 protein serine phosphatase [Streptomyces albidoflavus]
MAEESGPGAGAGSGGSSGAVSPDQEGARLLALEQAGLSSAADEGMDRFARIAARLAGVPVALVSVAGAEHHSFPGMTGLEAPLSELRRTRPCAEVVSAGRLIVRDARTDPRTRGRPMVEELSVAGYAGLPLVDDDGVVLGSLCAIDRQPREWTDREVEALTDLAEACAAEIRLRIVTRRIEEARGETAALLTRSELVLRASEVLADTTGVGQVRHQVGELITRDLRPSFAGLSLAQERIPWDATEGRWPDGTVQDPAVDPVATPWPTGRAAREKRTVAVHGIQEVRAEYGDEAAARWERLGFASMVCVPLAGTRRVLGALAVAWRHRHEPDLGELAVLTATAAYAARALERALFVDERIDVARQLQDAMLTALPSVPGLEMAALYRPAVARDRVGGDWYDAYRLPAAGEGEEGSEASGGPTLAATIGDITGHDIRAATLMGQARSMLRQADHDHPGAGPAAAVGALHHSTTTLDLGLTGTLIHAHLTPRGEGWELTWTNAGHPPPLLAVPGAPCRVLAEHEMMLYPGLAEGGWQEYRQALPPGSTLLLYTDGLVERRGEDIDEAIERLGALLAAGTGTPLARLTHQLTASMAGEEPDDDVALLALRCPGPHA